MSDGFKPTLDIVFISVSQDRKAICEILQEADISIYCDSTNDEFINEETEKGTAAILLLDINKEYFEIYFEEYPEKNYRDVAKSIAQKAKEKFATPAFLIAGSHLETDAEALLFGFEDVIGKQVNVFGGMAGDDYSFTEQFVFTNGKSKDCALAALIIDEDKIDVRGIATCGWKAVGTTKTVTKSEGNMVYTIDAKPALDMLKN